MSDKTIIRIERNRDNPFVMLDKRPLEDPQLSFKAKGVLAYLLSRPDNWHVRTDDLVNHSTDGKAAVWTALQELREAGHASIETFRTGDGSKLAGRRWVIYEVPRPDTKTSDTENQCNRKPLSLKSGMVTNKEGELIRKIPTKKDVAPASRGTQTLRGSGFGFGEKPSPSPKGLLREEVLAHKFFLFCVCNRLLVGKKRPNMSAWATACRDLLHQLEGDYARAEIVMDWYMGHFRDEWVPTCYSATTFCERFLRLEKAMKRQLSDNTEQAAPKSKVKVCRTEQEFFEE